VTVRCTTAGTLVVVVLVELDDVLVLLELDVDVEVVIELVIEVDVVVTDVVVVDTDVVVLDVATLVVEPPPTDVVVEELVLDDDGIDGGRSVPGGVTGETRGVSPPHVSI
jgi:hypothetical protein